MKRFSKLISIIAVFIVFITVFNTASFAATIGQALTTAETGWKRIDDNNSLINYSGSYLRGTTNPSTYNSTSMIIGNQNLEGKANFKFYGTKLRIISFCTTIGYSSNVQIKIDGIVAGNYSSIGTSVIYRMLAFEKTDLSLGVHSVEITPLDSTTYGTLIDAIDIDTTGYLTLISQPTNLITTSGNSKADLSWDSVDGATSYNIKRSTTAGGPYDTIATTSAITYSDTTVTNGTTYYYVVSAVVAGNESSNSNEVSATPAAPSSSIIEGNKAILVITMINGTQKEYDMTATEIENFVNWFDAKDNGVAGTKAYFSIKKNYNIKPFLNRWDYVVFTKIQDFEIKDYNE